MKGKETFAVLGLSLFGRRTAVGLYGAGASVIAVDVNGGLVQKIAQQVTSAVRADVMDWEALEHVGVFDVDTVVIGLRSSFEAAVLLINHLHKETKVKRIIAQVDSEEKAEVLRLVGADQVVFPALDTADRLVRRLVMPGLVEHVSLSPDAAIIEVVVPPSFVGKTMVELMIRAKYKVNVIGIKRGGADEGPGRMIVAPPAHTRFLEGDSLLLLGKTGDLDRIASVV
ncbi:MAG: TrkA family potassium uptake protein [Candidatus Eisenbacteria bacterium]|nr:TrkA family potassium uptake protein [Candidatus Eisenbacteria bacterium]